MQTRLIGMSLVSHGFSHKITSWRNCYYSSSWVGHERQPSSQASQWLWSHFTLNCKCQPCGGVKSGNHQSRYTLRAHWILVLIFMAMHSVMPEQVQLRPKWEIDRARDRQADSAISDEAKGKLGQSKPRPPGLWLDTLHGSIPCS